MEAILGDKIAGLQLTGIYLKMTMSLEWCISSVTRCLELSWCRDTRQTVRQDQDRHSDCQVPGPRHQDSRPREWKYCLGTRQCL